MNTEGAVSPSFHTAGQKISVLHTITKDKIRAKMKFLPF